MKKKENFSYMPTVELKEEEVNIMQNAEQQTEKKFVFGQFNMFNMILTSILAMSATVNLISLLHHWQLMCN